MVNFVWRVVSVYEKWSQGSDLGPEEVYEASSLLGTPTRKLESFLERYSMVFSRLIEERCAETSRGRVCIYSWSRRAYKRYFPAALDAGGTVLFFPASGGEPVTLSYPLHRAYELGVHGVNLPGEDPDLVSPRLDGWQVNLYYDSILGRWVFSTKYVLHNMFFSRGRLQVEEYGATVNPLVGVAERIASRMGLFSKLDSYKGWTFTLMVVGPEPATALRRLPEPEEADEYQLVLIAARKPRGDLLDPLESGRVGAMLGLESIAPLATRSASRKEAVERAERSLDYRSTFLWYLERGDKEHPEIYEAQSKYYEEWISTLYRQDAKALVVLLTSGDPSVVERLEKEVSQSLVEEVVDALEELRESLSSLSGGDKKKIQSILVEAGLDSKSASSASKALAENRVERALRIVSARLLEGLGVGEASTVLESAASRIRVLAKPK